MKTLFARLLGACFALCLVGMVAFVILAMMASGARAAHLSPEPISIQAFIWCTDADMMTMIVEAGDDREEIAVVTFDLGACFYDGYGVQGRFHQLVSEPMPWWEDGASKPVEILEFYGLDPDIAFFTAGSSELMDRLLERPTLQGI